jgi:hypothetical protein
MSDKKPPPSTRERSAIATKRAKKSPWGKWTPGGFQEREDMSKRSWKFGGQK